MELHGACTFPSMVLYLKLFLVVKDSFPKLQTKNYETGVSLEMAYLLSWFRRISFLFVVFPFGKLMLQRPLMGIGFNEVELKINLIGCFKVTIFN
jgi:hypothetical protein